MEGFSPEIIKHLLSPIWSSLHLNPYINIKCYRRSWLYSNFVHNAPPIINLQLPRVVFPWGNSLFPCNYTDQATSHQLIQQQITKHMQLSCSHKFCWSQKTLGNHQNPLSKRFLDFSLEETFYLVHAYTCPLSLPPTKMTPYNNQVSVHIPLSCWPRQTGGPWWRFCILRRHILWNTCLTYFCLCSTASTNII